MTMVTSSAVGAWRGRTGRSVYVAWGVGLMAAKYNLDRALAATFGIQGWSAFSYWRPIGGSLSELSANERRFLLTLIVLALPFIVAGVTLSVRRLRDAEWPLWLAALFFVPVINLVFFATLAAAPSKDATQSTKASSIRRWLPRTRSGSALLAVVATAIFGAALIAVATSYLKSYGWGVFVAVPFSLGLSAALIHSANEARTLRECLGVALTSVLFCGLFLLAFAIEGVICILMAAPLAAPLALLGAVVGYGIQRPRSGLVYSAAWMVLPLLVLSETHSASDTPLFAATSSVEIDAEPAVVWRHVVSFSDLPPPRELIFRSGIAYPIRARINGRGVGAVRNCEFSTGPFVEPITIWDEPRRLAFDVTRQPHPMRELSPYRKLTTAHLEGFFRSKRGEFRLLALPNHRTRLEGTTWYEQQFWPQYYWQLWSDYLVHRIHARVLEHIKAEAETSARS